MTADIHIVALAKGSERYVFLYNSSARAELLRLLGRYAANPELSFSDFDARQLRQKVNDE